MATTGMPRMVWAIVMAIGLVAGSASAEDHAFNFSDEVKKGEARPGFGFTNKVLVKTPTYTVGAVAVKDEIKAHRHKDGDHVLYIVSGQGTMTHGDQTITLKPGMVVHVPKGVVHALKVQGAELTLVDFAQPPFSPEQLEWVK
jgi:quercetin dioxygenase-like cupin family protein